MTKYFLGICIITAIAFSFTVANANSNQLQPQVPTLIFDLAGGAALPGNFLVTKEDGSWLQSYDTLGWDPRESGAVYTGFGLPMAAKASQILQGMLRTMSTGAQAGLRLGS